MMQYETDPINLPGQQRVEDDPERAERLSAPLRPEAEQHDVTIAMLDVERRGLAVQMFLAEQKP